MIHKLLSLGTQYACFIPLTLIIAASNYNSIHFQIGPTSHSSKQYSTLFKYNHDFSTCNSNYRVLEFSLWILYYCTSACSYPTLW